MESPPKEFIAIARRIKEKELQSHELYYGEGSFKERGDVIVDTLRNIVYQLLVYDESQVGGFRPRHRTNIVRIKVSFRVREDVTSPTGKNYYKVPEELPWED